MLDKRGLVGSTPFKAKQGRIVSNVFRKTTQHDDCEGLIIAASDTGRDMPVSVVADCPTKDWNVPQLRWELTAGKLRTKTRVSGDYYRAGKMKPYSMNYMDWQFHSCFTNLQAQSSQNGVEAARPSALSGRGIR
ncbi:hypothetical protein ACSV5G_20285 [Agrobacterium cavarae]|uniref:hypothetical protein n=1 Tax=Agrobacterium cavarae TaxID=2528239 RepID=UPI003FD3C173